MSPVNHFASISQRRHLCRQVVAAVLLAMLAGCASSEKPIDPWTRDKDAVLSAIKSGQQQNAALGQQIQELTRQIIKLQKSDKKQVSQLTAMEASLVALREKQNKLMISHKKQKKKGARGSVGGGVTAGPLAATKLPTLEEKIAKIEQDLDRTLEQTSIKPKIAIDDPQSGTPQPEQQQPEAKLVNKQPPLDPAAEKNSYSAAYLSLKSGRFEEASNKFIAHLKKFPRGSLTDQALYWLGESFLAQQRTKEALKTLQQLVRDYPASGKYGASLLRIASIYEKKGRKGDAKAAYLQLIQTQPNSNAAERARARLTKLK